MQNQFLNPNIEQPKDQPGRFGSRGNGPEHGAARSVGAAHASPLVVDKTGVSGSSSSPSAASPQNFEISDENAIRRFVDLQGELNEAKSYGGGQE